MKTFFIIPGFKQEPTSKSFAWLASYLSKKGFVVKVVPITWPRRTMTQYIGEFKDFYAKNKSKTNYVLGFSYGAVIAFATASEFKPKKIFLCSLSPDFKEDVNAMKPWVRKLIGKKRFADAKTRSAHVTARNLTIPSVVLYGEGEGREYPQLKIRCEETARFARRSKLVIVPSAPHNIAHPEYVKSLKEVLK